MSKIIHFMLKFSLLVCALLNNTIHVQMTRNSKGLLYQEMRPRNEVLPWNTEILSMIWAHFPRIQICKWEKYIHVTIHT